MNVNCLNHLALAQSPFWYWHCWCSLRESCSWFDWPMASTKIEWWPSGLALTCIATTTSLVEIIWILDKTLDHVDKNFKCTWLAPYPRPMKVIYDTGKFTGFTLCISSACLILNLQKQKIHSPMLFVNECIKLLQLCWKLCCLLTLHEPDTILPGFSHCHEHSLLCSVQYAASPHRWDHDLSRQIS